MFHRTLKMIKLRKWKINSLEFFDSLHSLEREQRLVDESTLKAVLCWKNRQTPLSQCDPDDFNFADVFNMAAMEEPRGSL